jgi:predicted MPP superfamily phosphohydrolase
LGAVALGRVDTQWIALEKVELQVPRWTLPGFKIGFLSDTHLTDSWSVATTKKALDFLIGEKPDVIVFGGDFVESSRLGALARIKDAFSALPSSSLPALAIMGNHDDATSKPEKVVHAVKATGFHMLRNESLEVKGVQFVGLDCLTFAKAQPNKFAALRGKDNVVVLFHEPDGVNMLEGLGSLMLAGHSHGGQICLPGGTVLHTPIGARQYIRGFYPEAPTPLYVSRGVGVTGLRIRLFCPPEATIITLNPRQVSA